LRALLSTKMWQMPSACPSTCPHSAPQPPHPQPCAPGAGARPGPAPGCRCNGFGAWRGGRGTGMSVLRITYCTKSLDPRGMIRSTYLPRTCLRQACHPPAAQQDRVEERFKTRARGGGGAGDGLLHLEELGRLLARRQQRHHVRRRPGAREPCHPPPRRAVPHAIAQSKLAIISILLSSSITDSQHSIVQGAPSLMASTITRHV
jgi:hypothetical protein